MPNPQVDPETEDFHKGLNIGEVVPKFELPDQHGHPTTYAPDGRNRSLILFHRSAAW